MAEERCDQCGDEFGYVDVKYKVYATLIVTRLGKVTWEFTMCKKCSVKALKGFSDEPLEPTPKGFK